MTRYDAPVECPVDGSNGLIVHLTCECCDSVVLVCEECLTGYRHPSLVDYFRSENYPGIFRPSTKAEIDRTGWWPKPAGEDGGPWALR